MRSLTVRQWCGGWSRGWSRGRGGAAAAAAAADEEDEDEGRVGLLQLNTYTLLPRAAFKDRSYTPASEGVKKKTIPERSSESGKDSFVWKTMQKSK